MFWKPVKLSQVTLTDPFWTEWQRVVVHQSLPHQWEQILQTGRLENFERAARGETAGHQGLLFNDSDVYKWAEAAAYAKALDQSSPNNETLALAAKAIGGAQRADGYISTKYQLTEGWQPWTALSSDHEMYCIGHLIEAGCAEAENGVSDSLLPTAIKAAECVANTFGPDKALGYCGHQEIEIGLCRLSDVTKDPKWRDLALWMIDRRGGRPSPFEKEAREAAPGSRADTYRRHFLLKGDQYDGRYFQDDKPLDEQDEPVGHSVRAMYFYSGAHDSHAEGMPAKLSGALGRIWRRLIDRRTYITGGIGSSGANEGFTDDYDLPNLNAYAETCAGIGLIMWASRMARLMDVSEPHDILERTLYNAVLSGIGEDGRSFFYENPLETRGGHVRQPWYSCACCPPNVARLILSLGSYIADVSAEGITVNHPIGSVIEHDGLKLEVASQWPWDGAGEVRVVSAPEEPRLIRMRNPRWAPAAEVRGPGQFTLGANGYWSQTRTWQAGDNISFNFPVKPQFLVSDTRVTVNSGKAALAAGPLIYCLEEADLDADPCQFVASSLTGAVDLVGLGTAKKGYRVSGSLIDPVWRSELPLAELHRKKTEAVLIPYYAWANRGSGAMQVWLLNEGVCR